MAIFTLANLEQSYQKNRHRQPTNGHARTSPVPDRRKAVEGLCDGLGIRSEVIHHVGSGMYCGVVDVTPEMAFSWLSERNHVNRNMPVLTVNCIAAAMKRGEFRLTHEAVAFDINGRLQDGQHRLSAIVDSFTTQKIVVFVGTDPENILVINTGRGRDWKDSARFNGEAEVTTRTQAIVRRMMLGMEPQRSTPTNATMQKFYELNKEAIDWTHEAIKVQRSAPANILAAVARASYHVDRKRLQLFCDILRTRIVDAEENTAPNTVMRWIESCRAKRVNPEASRVYAVASRAIKAFLDLEPWPKAVAASGDIYPLPREKYVNLQ